MSTDDGRGGSVQNRTGWTAEAAASIVSPLTYGDALELAIKTMPVLPMPSGDHIRAIDTIAHALMAVDFAARQQAQEPLIGYLAALGLRADEEGDIVSRDLAAKAIKEARGE